MKVADILDRLDATPIAPRGEMWLIQAGPVELGLEGGQPTARQVVRLCRRLGVAVDGTIIPDGDHPMWRRRPEPTP